MLPRHAKQARGAVTGIVSPTLKNPTLERREAVMADIRDAMAREIDEELRREQLLKLWDRYGTYLLAAAVAVVLAVGGWKYYESMQIQANQAASTQYIIALRDFATKQPDDAQKALDGVIAGGPRGYAALARLRLAGYDAAAGNTLDAAATYDQIAKDQSVDPILQDFARLQIAMLKFDTITFPELRNQLSPLANDKSPWRYSARELLGMGAAKAGLPEEARSHYQRLVEDRTTPQGIAERARVMLAVLEEAGRAKEATAAGATPAGPAPAEDKAKPGNAK
jgi:hypothetical protein